VPHPYGGRAIPLAERQTVALREKLKVTEGRLGELLQFGEENDAISEKVHRLSVALTGARDFPVARVFALLPPARGLRGAARRAARLGQERAGRLRRGQGGGRGAEAACRTMGAPQCGPAGGNPFVPWFGEPAEQLRSIALVPLGQTAVFGLLALGSEDPKRFFPEMGTLYLRRIGELCAAGVTARL
jgi:uncharacterized protein YigA (DUF484 family)